MDKNKKKRYSLFQWNRKKSIVFDEGYLTEIVDGLPISEPCKASILHYALYALLKCRKSKRRYYILTAITIIAPIIVLTLNEIFSMIQVGWGGYVTAVITLFSSIAAASLSLGRFYEDWIRNRSYLEKMIAAMMEAIQGIVPEDGSVSQEVQTDLMKKIIDLTQQHQIAWDNEKKQQGNLVSNFPANNKTSAS